MNYLLHILVMMIIISYLKVTAPVTFGCISSIKRTRTTLKVASTRRQFPIHNFIPSLPLPLKNCVKLVLNPLAHLRPALKLNFF